MRADALLAHFARNNAWSNARLAEACGRLSADELAAKRTSFFPSLLLTLRHIQLVDDYYVDALERGGRGRSIFADHDRPAPLAETVAAQRACDLRLIRFVDALAGDAALDAEVILERRTGPQVDRVGAILAHLFVHQIHHRGQVHAMLSGTAVAPPQLDEYFCADDRPRALIELAAALPEIEPTVRVSP